jgi:uncharacterized membrane protein YhhN
VLSSAPEQVPERELHITFTRNAATERDIQFGKTVTVARFEKFDSVLSDALKRSLVMPSGSADLATANSRATVTWLFALIVLLLGLTDIYALYSNQTLLVYVTKPATMLAIITFGFLRSRQSSPRYSTLILLGLTASLIGDVLLMLPNDRFAAGLFSFLIGHLFYIGAFRSDLKRMAPLLSALPFYGFGAVMFWILLPGLGDLKIPVTVYLIVILTMVWQAWNRFDQTRTRQSLFAVSGAVLFAISDSIIALNRFRAHFQAAEALIMSTYFSAQWLIALSV